MMDVEMELELPPRWPVCCACDATVTRIPQLQFVRPTRQANGSRGPNQLWCQRCVDACEWSGDAPVQARTW